MVTENINLKSLTGAGSNTPLDKSKALCLLADALRKNCSYKEAAQKYLNSMLIDRNNADTYFGLGVCYKNLKMYPKAVKYLEKAAELREDFYQAYFELGKCHLAEGISCGAIKNFVRAVQINPDNPEAILHLGLAHESCEEYELALMIYQKLIENSPRYIKGYENKASLLIKLNRYKEASILLHQIMKINPDYYRAYMSIGICFDKLGKRADAQRYYRKFLLKKPNSHQAQFVKTRLERLKNIKSANIPFTVVSSKTTPHETIRDNLLNK